MTALAIPESWTAVLADQLSQPYVKKLADFVAAERETEKIYPPDADVFAALDLTPYDQVKVVILGQDPYHGAGQAHGLSFSVRPGVQPPPSLVNMFKELRDDLGIPVTKQGFLEPWARQGVLLLNAVLTVRESQPNSHKGKGWERLTDAIIEALNRRQEPVIFVLWGAYAQKKAALIDQSRHAVISSAHPSPLSARSGFFGSKPFSKINTILEGWGKTPIDWRLSS
jgi:uracil-DNA glycosylase